nr:hypothetical protein [Hymenobacter volaticus]
MTASVDIITNRKSGVLSVPLAAVTTRTDSTAANGQAAAVQVNRRSGGSDEDEQASKVTDVQEVVFVIRDGKAVMTPVKTGISDFQNIEILSGLQAGAQVVSGPFRAVAKTLKDGALVVVKDAKSLNKEALKEGPGDDQ